MFTKRVLKTVSPFQSHWLLAFRGMIVIAFAWNVLCPTSLAQSVVLVGAGSTVPLPLYTKWADQYNKRDPKFQVRYLPLGTSEGINVVSHGSADFGAGEVPLDRKERAPRTLTEIPAALIGIVPIYNLPGVHGEMRFSGDLLAGIFLGKVKNWNAPAIAKLNPDISLPDLPITVIYRPAGKGSNYVFSDFLSKNSSQFRSAVGVSASPKWPVGVSAARSEDMVIAVKNEPGSIGYVELQYALESHLAYGLVQNPSGSFVKASNQTIEAACEAVESPRWDRLTASLTAASGSDSYPITSFTWIYVPTDSGDPGQSVAMSDLLKWIFNDGQAIASTAGYVALPPQLLKNVQAKLKRE